MAILSVNIDHVATLREARRVGDPDLVNAALVCERAGAKGITVHLRQDQRHIKERDIHQLKQRIRTRLDIEVSCASQMIAKVAAVRPDLVTLVPERAEELTTEGGLDVLRRGKAVQKALGLLRKKKIKTALFIDPDLTQIKLSGKLGAGVVEINTGKYAEAGTARKRRAELAKIRAAIQFCHAFGLQVNAGHGLNYKNIQPVAKIEGIKEFNIGFHIIARSVLKGLPRAVAEMARLVR